MVTTANVGAASGYGADAITPTTWKYAEGSTLGRTIGDAFGFKEVVEFRLAETYLVAAEGYMRSGNNALALQYINKLRGSRVSLKEGNLLNKEYLLPMEIYEYLDEKLGRIKANLNTSMSETQREKILETIKRNPNRFEESLTLKAMEADLYPYHFIK